MLQMMSKISFITRICLLAFFINLYTVSIQAQEARVTMEKVARLFKKQSPCQFSLELTYFDELKPISTNTATLTVDAKRFKFQNPEMTVWFDGRTQWSHFAGSDEVNVSSPTSSELQSINPMALLDIYKQGYLLSQSIVKYAGKECTQVTMRSTVKTSPISTILLVIDNVGNPLSIRLKQKSGNWLRIRVMDRKSLGKVKDDFFKFNPKDNLSLQIIDLR